MKKSRVKINNAPPVLPEQRIPSKTNGTPPKTQAVSSSKSKKIWIISLIGAAVAALAFLFVIIAAAGVFFFLGAKPGSTADDEIQTVHKTETDFQQWRGQIKSAIQGNLKTAAVSEESAQSIGWLDRHLKLPNEKAVRAALKRRIPSDVRLTSLVPVSFEEEDGEYQVKYRVGLRFKDSQYAVPVVPIKIEREGYKKYENLASHLLASRDLSPGHTYLAEEKRQLFGKGETLNLDWAVRSAAVRDGKWEILDAEPLPFQRSFEPRYLEAKGTAISSVIRSGAEIFSMAESQQAAMNGFYSRLDQIKQQVAEHRAELEANFPPKPTRKTFKFGGSGSGEPTKSAMRIGGGAASGAAIGAMAAGGEGAGWGALAGAGAGAIYDVFSKSSDSKKARSAHNRAYRRAVANWNAARKKIDQQVAAHEKNLLKEYETELRNAALRRTGA